MISKIIVGAAVLSIAVGANGAEPASNSPVATVVKLYKTYAWEAIIDEPELEGQGLLEQPKAELQKYFDTKLTDLIVLDDKCKNETHEVCRLDFQPIWAGQDPGATELKIKAGKTPDLVRVTYKFPGDGSAVALTYQLVSTEQGWRISDIRSADWSLLGVLEAKD